ncbi:Cys-Gln thioester bond-forming surface protein [Streptacidiphilus sp. N1-10]|uniref:Cys-Gln thioester bond-forming surface protein n=1 Tax=Streptacidiphilus jeojiensis TaxID=3229225 RepID=A0ABV6XKK3_9ACTN
MFGIPQRGAVRIGAALLATGAFAAGALTTATSAAADQNGSAVATLGNVLHGQSVHIPGEGQGAAGTVALTEDGQDLEVYCIDLYHGTSAGVKYQETGWDQSVLSDNPDRGKIQWILQHSYPVLSASALAQEAGVGSLSQDEAAAATQIAIWHFSDKTDATSNDATTTAVAGWLEQNATDVSEPAPSLALSPASVAGKSGDKLGPITVTTNAKSVGLKLTAPSGVQLVDGNGQAVTSAGNNDKLYVKVPAGTDAGTAQLSASATTSLPVGRAFKALRGDSQTMILAGTAPVQVNASAAAQWAPQGAVPAANATEDCKQGGVDVTVTNGGDQPWTAQVNGKSVTVAAGAGQSVFVPVKEGDTYSITVTGPNGFSKTFTGALKCRPTGGGTASSSSTPSAGASASASGSTPASGAAAPSPSASGGLAETGASSSTPVIAGVGAALLVLGGGVVFFLRRQRGGAHAG